MIYILATMVLYTVALMMIAQSSRRLDPTLSAAIINIVAATIPTTIAIKLFNAKLLTSDKNGFLFALGAGLLIALYTIMLGKSFSVNKVGIVTPVIFGGTLVLSSVLSVILFKEKITALNAVGIGVILLGFAIVVYSHYVSK